MNGKDGKTSVIVDFGCNEELWEAHEGRSLHQLPHLGTLRISSKERTIHLYQKATFILTSMLMCLYEEAKIPNNNLSPL
jgi:hypothetical protein